MNDVTTNKSTYTWEEINEALYRGVGLSPRVIVRVAAALRKNRKEGKFNRYVCTNCGHEVYAETNPRTMKWTDGHICRFLKG
jgi:hypothetical protein